MAAASGCSDVEVFIHVAPVVLGNGSVAHGAEQQSGVDAGTLHGVASRGCRSRSESDPGHRIGANTTVCAYRLADLRPAAHGLLSLAPADRSCRTRVVR